MEAAIWHQLEGHFYRSATFLAERLVATDTSNENSKFILATCYYRSGQTKSAYHILKKTESPKCVFLFARCCLELKIHIEGKLRLLTVWPRPEVADITLGKPFIFINIIYLHSC
jgi:anaphase-promoting complex subunit 3